MKNICMIALLTMGTVCAAPAFAQVYGQFTGADPLPVNGRLFGGYVLSSSNTVGLLGQLRMSFYQNIDFGFHGGFSRQDHVGGDLSTVRLGTDFKVGLTKTDETHPFSSALGGAIGIETGDNFHILTLGPTFVVSRTMPLGSTGSVTPYGRIGIAFANVDIGPLKDNDLQIPLRFGGDFRFGQQFGVAVELQLNVSDSVNDDVGLAAGVNLPF